MKNLKLISMVALSFFASQNIYAATCGAADLSIPGTRSFTVTVNPDATCYGSGTGNVNGDNNDFTGYTFLEKASDDFISGSQFITAFNGQGTTTGTFDLVDTIWDTYNQVLLVFKSGQGQADPDWVAFKWVKDLSGKVTMATSGGWSISTNPSSGNGQQSLSHFNLYGCTQASNPTCAGAGNPPDPVPVPAAVWLFGSGLAGLIGFQRRKNIVAV